MNPDVNCWDRPATGSEHALSSRAIVALMDEYRNDPARSAGRRELSGAKATAEYWANDDPRAKQGDPAHTVFAAVGAAMAPPGPGG